MLIVKIQTPEKSGVTWEGEGEGSCYGFVTRRYTGDAYAGKQSFPIPRKPKKVDNKVDKRIAKLNEANKENGWQRKERRGRHTQNNITQLKRHPCYERCCC